VKPRSLVGVGLYLGFGLGQMSAWWMLRADCHNASAMAALSNFGPGMSITGLLWLIYEMYQRNRTS